MLCYSSSTIPFFFFYNLFPCMYLSLLLFILCFPDSSFDSVCLLPFFISCFLVANFCEVGSQPITRCHCPNMEMPVVPSSQFDRPRTWCHYRFPLHPSVCTEFEVNHHSLMFTSRPKVETGYICWWPVSNLTTQRLDYVNISGSYLLP